jgi:hypothetical protein
VPVRELAGQLMDAERHGDLSGIEQGAHGLQELERGVCLVPDATTARVGVVVEPHERLAGLGDDRIGRLTSCCAQ